MNLSNPFTISGILIVIFNFPLLVLLTKYGKSTISRIYALHIFAVLIWGIGSLLIGWVKDLPILLIIWGIAYTGVLFIPAFFYHSVHIITKDNHRWKIIFCYSQAIIFIILLTIDNITHPGKNFIPFYSMYFHKATTIYTLSFVFWILFVIASHYKLLLYYQTTYPDEKNRLRNLLWAIMGFLGGSTNFLPAYGVPFYPYGNFLVPLHSIFVTDSILRHQLFEINIVFKKSLIYSFLILLVALFYFGIVVISEKFIQGFWGYKSITISIVTAFVIGILFFPLHNRIQQLVDRIIFKKTTEEISNENEMLRAEVLKTEKLKSVAVLASGMAHEIKNPLTALKTFSEYLPHKLDDKEFLRKFSRIVGGEVNRIDQLVNELLEFARPAPAHFKPCNINKLITDTLDFLNSKFLQKNITVKIKLSPECNDPIMLDSNKMRQALLNIFLNAIDAMNTGGTLRITVIATEHVTCEGVSRPSGRDRAPLGQTKRPLISEEAKQSDTNKIAASPTAPRPKGTPFGRNDTPTSPDLSSPNVSQTLSSPNTSPTLSSPNASIGDPQTENGFPLKNCGNDSENDRGNDSVIKITITDTGCGIEKDDLITIFDPFYSTKDSGSGLGLPITHGIIKNHGGEIKVASIVGQGTTFTLILPRNMKNSP